MQVLVGERALDQFALEPGHTLLRRIALPAAALGTSDTVELAIVVDKTFVPATLSGGASSDPRELGVRVFHAVVDVR